MSIAVTDLDSVDLFDVEVFADGPPHQLFARLRAEAPVHWTATSEERGFWSLTKATDIAAVSRDVQTFSSHAGGIFIRDNQVAPLEAFRNMLICKDPPEHTKYRLIVQKAFTPHTVAKQEQQVRDRVTRLIDGVCERGECDLVADLAVQLPLEVISEMLGVPQDDRSMLFNWTARLEHAQTEADPDDGMATVIEMAGYLAGLLEDRRKSPRDDLVTALLNAEVDGERLNDLELMMFFAILMFGGNDTTRNTISGGVAALCENPGERHKLLEDPGRIPRAAEEMLRWVSAIMHFRRTATVDTEIRGVPIRAGDKVVMWYVSANRDEDVYADPQRFDVTRAEHDHQAFGGGGRHFCLGAGLARLELRVMFEELLRRLPDLELAGPVTRARSNWVNGLTSMPVRFSPTARATNG